MCLVSGQYDEDAEYGLQLPFSSHCETPRGISFVRGLAWSKALREREGAVAESVRPNPKAAREIPCDSTGCWDYVDGSIYTDHRGGKRY